MGLEIHVDIITDIFNILCYLKRLGLKPQKLCVMTKRPQPAGFIIIFLRSHCLFLLNFIYRFMKKSTIMHGKNNTTKVCQTYLIGIMKLHCCC